MPVRILPLVFWFSLLIWQTACSQIPAKSTSLSGQITLREGWRPIIYLVKPAYYRQLISPYEGALVDSTVLAADGSFTFQDLDWLHEKGVYLLFVQREGSRFFNEIAGPPPAENYICLVLEPGTDTRLLGNAWELTRSYQLQTAHPESRQIARLFDSRKPLYLDFEQAHPADESVEEWSAHGSPEVQQAINQAIYTFLDTAQSVWPLFTALRLCAAGNDFRDQPELFLRVLDRLNQQTPKHPWTDQLAVYLVPERLPVLMGEKMPDFALPTPAGDTLRWSDVRAKLLLVDFWASWCAPCRREMKEIIRPLYDAYREQGFQVLGVSIDRSREAWEAAIRKDGAVWPNVSDLLGDASPVRQSLKFEYIPSNYLLDSDGRLLARNVHGEALRDFVSKYLQEH